MPDLVVGVDGGNSKTDLVLADTEGRLLSWVRGPGTRPHTEGMEITTERLAHLGRHALAEAGLPDTTPVSVGAYFLANVDRRAQERLALRQLTRLGVADRTLVRNDTLAVLNAGAPDGWGVAVVSGAGINAAAVHPGAVRPASCPSVTSPGTGAAGSPWPGRAWGPPSARATGGDRRPGCGKPCRGTSAWPAWSPSRWPSAAATYR